MIKVLVVVSGLVGFVPLGNQADDPSGLAALLVNSERMSAGDHGMPLHLPALRLKLDAGSDRTFHFDNLANQAQLKVTNPIGTITLDAQNDFAQMASLTPNKGDATVALRCLEGVCVDSNQRSVVSAVVNFEGRWTTRSAARCDRAWNLPPRYRDQAKLDFRKASNLDAAKPDVEKRRLATGIVLEVAIEQVEDLGLYLGGKRQTLQLSDPSICHDWIDPMVDECLVFEVENWPAMHIDDKCKVQSPPPECRLDAHFAALYDLLGTPPSMSERWLPFVADGPFECDPTLPGPGQPPGFRCPPVFLSK